MYQKGNVYVYMQICEDLHCRWRSGISRRSGNWSQGGGGGYWQEELACPTWGDYGRAKHTRNLRCFVTSPTFPGGYSKLCITFSFFFFN